MKYLSAIMVMLSFFMISYSQVAAGSITVVDNKAETTEEIFSFFADYYLDKIPESYKYISLDFKNVDTSPKLYKSLQVLVYLDVIKNTDQNIYAQAKMDRYTFLNYRKKIFAIDLEFNKPKIELQKEYVTKADYSKVKRFIKEINISKNTLDLQGESKKIKTKNAILNDVLKTISEEHYNNSDFSKVELIESAIEGVAKGTGDKHTVYFPPTDSKSFNDTLAGEYEGIGSYVDIETPGELKIISPMPGSPAEKAGLKGGDIVTKVDDKEITKSTSLSEVISWIKGPKGTTVNLTVTRGEETFIVPVIREKIVLSNIEEEKINHSTYYVKIKTFGENVSGDFKKSLENIKSEKNIKKIIIDLRNNGGGYLSEVTDMLSYVIAKGEKTAVIKYIDDEYVYNSAGEDILDLSKYEIIILQNTGTASASEILIGTLKDYFPEIVLVGEKSYGKGSVQTIRPYTDGSTLKYTIAKWYTGKSETGIDGIGITPDFEVEYDFEAFKKDKTDNQLQKAKDL